MGIAFPQVREEVRCQTTRTSAGMLSEEVCRILAATDVGVRHKQEGSSMGRWGGARITSAERRANPD
jgi:hypothetical protein